MQDKHIKDLVIALGVILLIAFGFHGYILFYRTNSISEQSEFLTRAIDEGLLNQIQQIEESIKERKVFVFTVNKDPLRQDLIVQTKLDLQKQWADMVRSMMRLTAILKDSEGTQKAMIAFGGQTHLVQIGDVLNNKTITSISSDKVYFEEDGKIGFLTVEPIPPKPVQLDQNRSSTPEYNW